MAAKRKALQATQRVAVHRKRQRRSGLRRVEVSVPVSDAELVRQIAAMLRGGGLPAERLKRRIGPSLRPTRAPTGIDLVEFFRRSPLFGVDLDLVRDRSIDPPRDLFK